MRPDTINTLPDGALWMLLFDYNSPGNQTPGTGGTHVGRALYRKICDGEHVCILDATDRRKYLHLPLGMPTPENVPTWGSGDHPPDLDEYRFRRVLEEDWDRVMMLLNHGLTARVVSLLGWAGCTPGRLEDV